MTQIPDDAIRETWETIYDKTVRLAAIIESHCRDTGERFDAMVVVPRGSYYPANIVARELNFSSTDLLHACIGSYQDGVAARNNSFKLGQMPTDAEVAGKRLLIIEEVCETGHTLNFLTARLKEQGAKSVRTGVLHYKPGRNETDYIPDWYVEKVEEWILYPWEQHEANGKNSVVKATAL